MFSRRLGIKLSREDWKKSASTVVPIRAAPAMEVPTINNGLSKNTVAIATTNPVDNKIMSGINPEVKSEANGVAPTITAARITPMTNPKRK